MKQFNSGQLQVFQYSDRKALGEAAAGQVAARITTLLNNQPFINIIFAAAPSQREFLAALKEKSVTWNKINAFHMDEYIGLRQTDQRSFGHFLRRYLFDGLSLHQIYYIDGHAEDPNAECHGYASLLKKYPADIVCLGIGENAHLAFNDPHVADFDDPFDVKIVALSEKSREQQVADECFGSASEVPAQAITLTIPALLRAKNIFAMVPGLRKAEAIRHTIESPVSTAYPSTTLRNHAGACLLIDDDSASELTLT